MQQSNDDNSYYNNKYTKFNADLFSNRKTLVHSRPTYINNLKLALIKI